MQKGLGQNTDAKNEETSCAVVLLSPFPFLLP
jgi:hypothetical protein